MDSNKENNVSGSRGKIDLSVNSIVVHIPTNTLYKIKRQIDFQFIEAQNENGHSRVLPIQELGPATEADFNTDLIGIDDDLWLQAEKRYALIEPIISGEIKGRAAINQYAKDISVSSPTLYRWVKKYEATGSLTSLLAQKDGWTTGKSRLSQEQENIIKEVIETFYLTPQRLSQTKIIQQVRNTCYRHQIPVPADNSIRKRMNELSEKVILSRRGQRERAANKFQPKPKHFPNVSYPLDVIQIDHTQVDLILVDDKTRQPIGRPWLTLAIDVYSRMICGYYLSLDAPSETSVGLCVSYAVLPKESWLEAKKIGGKWEVWGLPNKIHVDNGSDFRSNTFRRACAEYGINLEFRPVRTPHYGGHIERLIGTMMEEVHQLPGTTFSNVKHKDNYDSEKNACLTIDEFETWLLKQIVHVYHKKIHSALGMSPETKWEEGIFGTDEAIGRGLPPIPSSPETLMLDFMPYAERTIQNTGVTWDGLRYFDFVLLPYIGLTDNGKARKFIFRRDPRDVSKIYFYQPDSKQYIPIHTADQSFPHMTLWELKNAKQRLRDRGRKNYNEYQVLDTIKEMQQHLETAQAKTKKARRLQQRKTLHQRNTTPVEPAISPPIDNTQPIEQPLISEKPDDIVKPLSGDDIE
ncbi:DDE-type integrase/transposase/recombinase [Neisseria sp. Dent CA1/247]|uniref:Mu transposase C-terminal domain-containing protein n=1 Tax=Neisseria sp. Dent CA1/247 TaxID=2912675 RepID=UPI001FD311B1|nr:Mu transposase C-terminal domain-containing protein [Neisseria sp. Dent CA1/247]UOO77378.1 DDE-type integrase/transposase/recombinase [Neisseria sp. Dent CA1/247]